MCCFWLFSFGFLLIDERRKSLNFFINLFVPKGINFVLLGDVGFELDWMCRWCGIWSMRGMMCMWSLVLLILYSPLKYSLLAYSFERWVYLFILYYFLLLIFCSLDRVQCFIYILIKWLFSKHIFYRFLQIRCFWIVELFRQML